MKSDRRANDLLRNASAIRLPRANVPLRRPFIANRYASLAIETTTILMENLEFDIGLSFAKEMKGEQGHEIEEAFRSTGLEIFSEYREEEGIFAAAEWMIPAGIAVFIAQKYIGTLLQEAAKDHYSKLKSAFSKLLGKTSGQDREITFRIVSSTPGKVSTPIAPALAVYANAADGKVLKFTFSPDLERRLHEPAIDALLSLLAEHYQDKPDDPLSRQIESQQQREKKNVYLRFVEDDAAWTVINPAAEIRRRKDKQ